MLLQALRIQIRNPLLKRTKITKKVAILNMNNKRASIIKILSTHIALLMKAILMTHQLRFIKNILFRREQLATLHALFTKQLPMPVLSMFLIFGNIPNQFFANSTNQSLKTAESVQLLLSLKIKPTVSIPNKPLIRLPPRTSRQVDEFQAWVRDNENSFALVATYWARIGLYLDK